MPESESPSVSASISESLSKSLSESLSPSLSASKSPSASRSPSLSPSGSVSPSAPRDSPPEWTPDRYGDVFFYEQDFEAGAPLTPARKNGYYTAPRYLNATTPPLVTYPEVNEADIIDVLAGVGANGSYGVWFPPASVGDIPEGELVVGIRYDGRNPGWGVPGGQSGSATLAPIVVQDNINVVEMDVQFRSEVFVGPVWGDTNPYLNIDLFSGTPVFLGVALNQDYDAPYGEDWIPNTHYWYMWWDEDAAPVDPIYGYRYTRGNAHSAQWSSSQFDLDGAFHKIRIEWKPCTYVLSPGVPIGWDTIQVNADGWVRATMDGVTIMEATGLSLISNLWSPATLAYDSFVPDPSANPVNHGYTHVSNCQFVRRTPRYDGYAVSSTLTGEFARDVSAVQSADVDGLGAQDSKGRVLFWPSNTAGFAVFAMNFDMPTSGPQYFFAVRGETDAPQLEFKRDGSMLIVQDAAGEIARVANALIEDQYATGLLGDAPYDYVVYWKFSSYVHGVAQPDGYIEVYLDPYPSGAMTTLLVRHGIVVACHDPAKPYTHLWWCPQGDMRHLSAYEGIHPDQINRYGELRFGSEEYLGGVFDNIKAGVFIVAPWLDIADYVTVELDSTEFINGVATVRVATWAGTAGIPVDVRLQNVTDDVTVALGETVTSTTPSTQLFTATLTPGVKRYRLQVSAEPGVDVFAMGQIQVPRVS